LAHAAIAALDLDLRGLTVLTEAATGPFSLTASLAALAGAERVYILARSGPHGSVDQAVSETVSAAAVFRCSERVTVLASRDDPRVGEADLITNLRGVRPLDKLFIARLKPTAVIPLMFESWEFRPDDLDLPACRARGIIVLGTNESDPRVDVLSYVGPVVLKLLLEAGIELLHSKVLVLGSGVFAEIASSSLRSAGAEVHNFRVTDCGQLTESKSRNILGSADALLVAEHVDRMLLIGEKRGLDPITVAEANPGLVVVHLAGNVDRKSVVDAGLTAYPTVFAPPGYMSVTTAYCGPAPLIRLHCAGLKVGEIAARARRAGLSPAAAETQACRNQLCQPVAGR